MTLLLKAERELVAYTKRTFGEHLGALLLCGYGEDRAPSSRDFAVELTDESDAVTRLRLMFVAEGPAGTTPSLPRLKEPLVLLALMQLLMDGGSGAAAYESHLVCGDVPALLGWDETDESRETVAAAVTRYFHTFYQLAGGSDTGGRGAQGLTRKLRLLSGYEVGDGVGSGEDGGAKCSVAFAPDFSEALRRGELLGIDWKRVKGLTPLPLEFFNL
jgi:hypothetical protein